jgi:hypothetical protein
MHLPRVSLANKFLLGLGAAALALLSGCATVTLTNLTPASLPGNPSSIYTFTLRVVSHSSAIPDGTIAPHIVLDGQNFPMHRSALGNDLYEFEYQLPPGRDKMAYYYLVDYNVKGNGLTTSGQQYTAVTTAEVVHRYVLSLESSRGPVGARVNILGRGFNAQDAVYLDDTPARTVFDSTTSLSFFVPALPARNYGVTLGTGTGSTPVGTFRIDPTELSVTPASLTLGAGEQQSLTFTLSNPAPAGGLLIEVATDIPESVIMPEVLVPEGQTGVTINVQGGKPGTGSLVLKGYGAGGEISVPVTVH